MARQRRRKRRKRRKRDQRNKPHHFYKLVYRADRDDYLVRWTDADGSTHQKSLRTSCLKEAELRRDALEKNPGDQFIHIDETKVLDQELLSDLVASYLKQAEMAETTRDRRSEVFRSLLDYWNGPAMDLTPDIINAWVGRPSKKTKRALSPTTQHLRIGTVSSLLNWAVRNNRPRP